MVHLTVPRRTNASKPEPAKVNQEYSNILRVFLCDNKRASFVNNFNITCILQLCVAFGNFEVLGKRCILMMSFEYFLMDAFNIFWVKK